MNTRICYQEKVNAGTPQACTVEKFNELLDSPVVKKICEQIANLDAEAPDYEEKKGALKRRLPVLIPHACAFVNANENANENWSGKRKSELAVPSGLVMLDVDHVRPLPSSPQGEVKVCFETEDGKVVNITAQQLSAEHVYLVAVTPSGKGLRIIGERQPEESIESAMVRLAKSLGIDTYDAVTKDLARASYMMPREYVLWVYEAWLCGWPSQELKAWWQNGACNAPAKDEAKPAMEMPGTVTAAGTDDASINEGAQGASEASGIPPERSGGVITQGEAAAEGLCFKGIPYSEIVEQLMTSIGANGGAIQGERNTVYFSLANYMRYICDFDAALLLQVLPDFGLAAEERKQAIHSALGRPRKMTVPTVLLGAIALAEKCKMEDLKWKMEDGKYRMERAVDMPMPALPELLQTICRKLPEEYRPAMVIASLPVLGTLATRIRFEYLDRQVQSLSFFSCITAPAASGKSFIRKPIDLLLTPINEQDQIEREKERAYKEALRASKNSKNQPQDPRACPRNNGVAISIAKLLQLLTYSEGKHLIGIGEEMDTLVKSERAGVWSQKSDIYRLAFDNAEYGQAYMSEASFSAHIAVYYNLLMTGTPNSMKRFFKDLENGLATRVCFAQLPDTSFTEIPVFAPYSEAEREEIIRWARVLEAERGMVSCPQVGKVIGDWLETKRQQAIDADSHAADTLRRRSAVIGFRAGMLCWLLEGHQWTKTVGEFAEWVAEYVFRNQMELWGEQMEQELTSNIEMTSGEHGTASSLLGLLERDFTTGDLISLRAKKGQSVSSTSVNSLLCRWKKTGRIDKTGEGKWRKLN